MAGCDTRNHPGQGDHTWSIGRLEAWIGIGAGIGGTATFLELASILGASIGGLAALAALGAILLAAAAAGLVAMFIGYGVEWFTRLKVQSPSQITFVGWVVCVDRNLGNPGPPAFCDGDWTCNLAPHLVGVAADPTKTWAVTDPGGLTVQEVRTRTAPGAEFAGTVFDPDHGNVDILHTEIGSHIGDYAAVGGMVGTVAGVAAGIIAGIVLCAALAIVTFGLFAAVCALLIALGAALGAAVGGAVGQWVGGGIGAIVDAATDFDKAGDSVSASCLISVTGRWVTDRSHQHNEVHDVASVQVMECGTAAASSPLAIAGAVGIGRHPTGPDP